MGNKYHAKKTNGYASKREANDAVHLRILAEAGHIRDLKEQVSFELIPAIPGERAVRYVADFTYWDGDEFVVADSKGMRTPVYKLKRRLLQHVHGITIREL